jgi:glutamyl/glutaminyl-tRNA synthetase
VKEFRDKGYLPEALVNYLALIGWSPGHNEELLPADELARRFKLESVAHSAGIFDEDKLAWANRHYIKLCPPDRLAALATPILQGAGQIIGSLKPSALGWLELTLPGLASSVDRLTQLPDRLSTVFGFDAAATMGNGQLAGELRDPNAAAVVRALAIDLATAPRLLDKETFRASANRVKDQTGQKGKALFHPIRVALTGAAEGPELDLIVPAIDRAVELGTDSGFVKVIGCRERASLIAGLL